MSTLNVAVHADAAVLRLVVSGDLDADGAQVLLRAAATAATCRAGHVEIDLSSLRSFTPAGVLGVTGCRRLGGHVPGGVSFRVHDGAGSQALLASLAVAP